MTTVQKLAQKFYDAFVTDTRDDGTDFVKLADGSPEWMTEVALAAHGGMFPDDWKYECIKDCANTIAESDDPEEAEYEMEADVYNAALIRWLGSDLRRADYVDEAREEGLIGSETTLYEQLQIGQVQEKREVFRAVLEGLREQAEEEEEEESVEDDTDEE